MFSNKLSNLGQTNQYSSSNDPHIRGSKYNLNKYFQDKTQAINQGEYGYFDTRNNPSTRKRKRRAASVSNINKRAHTMEQNEPFKTNTLNVSSQQRTDPLPRRRQSGGYLGINRSSDDRTRFLKSTQSQNRLNMMGLGLVKSIKNFNQSSKELGSQQIVNGQQELFGRRGAKIQVKHPQVPKIQKFERASQFTQVPAQGHDHQKQLFRPRSRSVINLSSNPNQNLTQTLDQHSAQNMALKGFPPYLQKVSKGQSRSFVDRRQSDQIQSQSQHTAEFIPFQKIQTRPAQAPQVAQFQAQGQPIQFPYSLDTLNTFYSPQLPKNMPMMSQQSLQQPPAAKMVQINHNLVGDMQNFAKQGVMLRLLLFMESLLTNSNFQLLSSFLRQGVFLTTLLT